MLMRQNSSTLCQETPSESEATTELDAFVINSSEDDENIARNAMSLVSRLVSRILSLFFDQLAACFPWWFLSLFVVLFLVTEIITIFKARQLRHGISI